MSDIVERLRDPVDDGVSLTMCHMLEEAAAEITRLQAELAEARDKAFKAGWDDGYSAALDEAAAIAEDHTRNYSPGTFKGLRENMAQTIRALKSPKPPIL